MLWAPHNMGMSATHCQGNVREFQSVWRVVTRSTSAWRHVACVVASMTLNVALFSSIFFAFSLSASVESVNLVVRCNDYTERYVIVATKFGAGFLQFLFPC